MFSLNYREFWSSVSGYLAEELDQIVASAQAKWSKQHDSNGAHTNVTATAVETDTVSASTYTAPFGSINVALNGETAATLSEPESPPSGYRLRLNDGDWGTGLVNGPWVRIGRNTAGDGAAGCLILTDRNGVESALWVEGGKLRIGSVPSENDILSHTGGTVVGTQS